MTVELRFVRFNNLGEIIMSLACTEEQKSRHATRSMTSHCRYLHFYSHNTLQPIFRNLRSAKKSSNTAVILILLGTFIIAPK